MYPEFASRRGETWGRALLTLVRDKKGRIGSLLIMTEDHQWPDLAGRLIEVDKGRRHILPVRVYFEDTDFSGLVYHASYVRWCERGRSDFLRLLGGDHRKLIDGSAGTEPAAFVVRSMSFDFLRPARIDEVLEIETRVKDVGAASLTLGQRVLQDGRALVDAEVTVVLISVSGKPLRISSTLREAFGRPAGGVRAS